jgi:hypothetical protein
LNTILDTAHSWFLESANFRGVLELIVVEGTKATIPEAVVVAGSTIDSIYRVAPSSSSSRVSISFPEVYAWQHMAESFARDEEAEIHDGGFLRQYQRSRYLEFLSKHSLLEHPFANGVKHYRLLTENDILDIVANAPPVLSRL